MKSEYDALADTIKISDIAKVEDNARILTHLKNNDPDFTSLWLFPEFDEETDYCPEGESDMGWLGYFVGKNTLLKQLSIVPGANFYNIVEPFWRGVNRNKSIERISLHGIDISLCNVLQMLKPFFGNNLNLTEIELMGCDLGAEGCRSLSLAVGACKKSLKSFELTDCEIGDEPCIDIILALSMHPQLEMLDLDGNNIGRNACAAVGTLLQWTTTQLSTLNLNGNDIDDEGIEALMAGLIHSRQLKKLRLSRNSYIAARGWKALSTLLESSSRLEDLTLVSVGIGDEGTISFANALARNCTLKNLILHGNPAITSEGWAAFSKLACDTSSVNKTFLSNHILQSVKSESVRIDGLPGDLFSSLNLNQREDKKKVAMIKILRHHTDIDLQPFFEWEFKLLPLVMNWLDAASDATEWHASSNTGIAFADLQLLERNYINERKLSAVYQFVRGMPALYIESCAK